MITGSRSVRWQELWTGKEEGEIIKIFIKQYLILHLKRKIISKRCNVCGGIHVLVFVVAEIKTPFHRVLIIPHLAWTFTPHPSNSRHPQDKDLTQSTSWLGSTYTIRSNIRISLEKILLNRPFQQSSFKYTEKLSMISYTAIISP